MKKMHPLLAEYQKSIPKKIELIQFLITQIKKDYNRENLRALDREVHKIAGNSGVYGYQIASQLCQEESLILEKLVTHFPKVPEHFFEKLDIFLLELKKAFEINPVDLLTEVKNQTQNGLVVIVDDDEDLQRILCYEFQEKGYETKSLLTGIEGLTFLKHEKNLAKVVLVVLDRILPDMDGLSILQQLQFQFKSRIPVLFLSVLSTEKDVVQGLQSGAIDYIAKPFNVSLFMRKAEHMINIAK